MEFFGGWVGGGVEGSLFEEPPALILRGCTYLFCVLSERFSDVVVMNARNQGLLPFQRNSVPKLATPGLKRMHVPTNGICSHGEG